MVKRELFVIPTKLKPGDLVVFGDDGPYLVKKTASKNGKKVCGKCCFNDGGGGFDCLLLKTYYCGSSSNDKYNVYFAKEDAVLDK